MVCASCTANSPASPADADGSAGASPGGSGGAAGMTGGAGGSGGGAGGGAGSGSTCACTGPLAVDVVGDGDPLHLTAADYVAGGHTDLPIANITANTGGEVVPACLAAPVPWAECTTGGGSQVYWIQACAGPGGGAPCIWLNGNAVNPISLGSLYVDRSGRAIRGYVSALASSFVSFQTPLGQTIEGTFSMTLEDGRTLTATFRVCLLASYNFG